MPHNHHPLRDDCDECDDLRDEYRKPEYHEGDVPVSIYEYPRYIGLCQKGDCYGRACKCVAARFAELENICEEHDAEISTLRAALQKAEEERDAIRDSSFCTKCGWSGVPLPLIGGERRITLDWQCGNSECGYLVPPPKSALIAALTEGKESAESRAQKAMEAVRKYGRHADACTFRDLTLIHGTRVERPCNCGLSEVLREGE